MALAFASGQLVNHGSAASIDDLPATAITVVSWVYRTANGSNQEIITKDNSFPTGFAFLSDNDFGEGSLRFFATRTSNHADSIGAPGNVPLNTWVMVAATYTFNDAAGAKLFQGTLTSPIAEIATYSRAQQGAGAYMSDAAALLYVGNLQRSTSVPFLGRIARAAVFNRALSLDELRSLQWAWRPLSGCVLLTDYHGTGTQPDLSGAGNNGTVTGATSADHVPARLAWQRQTGRTSVVAALATVALVSTNLSAPAPAIAAATIQQKAVLASQPIAATAPVLSSSALAQAHALTASQLATSASAIGLASISQIAALVALQLAAPAPAISASTLTATGGLASVGLATAPPALSVSVISQRHALASQQVATPAPVISTSGIQRIVHLAAQGLAPTAPAISIASIGQRYSLVAVNATTGAPVIAVANSGQMGQMLAANVTTAAPAIAAVLVGQGHAFVAGPLNSTAPSISTSGIGQRHALAASGITAGPPALGFAAIVQLHVLTSGAVTTGGPSIGLATGGFVVVLTAQSIATNPPVLSTVSIPPPPQERVFASIF